MTVLSENMQNIALLPLKNISTTTMHMAIKLGRLLTYHKELPPTWSFGYVVLQDQWPTKNITSRLPECSWPPKLAGWWLTFLIWSYPLRSHYLISYLTLWSRDLARSCENLKPSYLHYHSAHGHQTWQDGDLPEGAPSH